VFRVNQLGGLSVNGGRPVKGHSAGQLTELNLPMSIYVGGYPASYNRQAGLTSGFHGAIQRVYTLCLKKTSPTFLAITRESIDGFL